MRSLIVNNIKAHPIVRISLVMGENIITPKFQLFTNGFTFNRGLCRIISSYYPTARKVKYALKLLNSSPKL